MTIESAVPSSAQAIKAQAASWLARSVSEDWTEQDQVDFEAWLSASASHKLAYWRLDAGWQRSERLTALRPQLQERPLQRRNFLPFLRIGAGVAAAVILVVAAGFYALKPETQTFSTTVGGHRILTLADGSQIELNTDTQVHVQLANEARKVTLDRGEAYFQIKHDPDHPFVVVVGLGRIVDLGTKFAVRRESDRLQVTLVEGKAQLETGQVGKPAVVLTPGDVAIASAKGLFVSRKPSLAFSAELSWRRGVLVFDNTPLSKVAQEFNRYNDNRLVVADAGTGRIGIGGTFKANDVAAFAEVAQSLLGLHIENRGNEIVISYNTPGTH